MYIEQGSVLRTLSHNLFLCLHMGPIPDHVVMPVLYALHATQLWLKNMPT